jgi:PAS domain S-box-containing protein
MSQEELKKQLGNAKETIRMLNQELLEANQGMIALTLELKQTQQEYKNIFENSIVGIYRATLNHKFKIVNPAMATLLGYDSPEELINSIKNINEEIYIATEKRRKFIKKLFDKGIVIEYESRVENKNGDILWISENAKLLKDESGKIIGYEEIIQDINHRKQIEKELTNYRRNLESIIEERTDQLKKKNQKLQEAYKREEFYKDLFTHDINNILQSLLSGIQVCKYNFHNPGNLKEILRIFKSEVLRGARLVSNIRKLSELETDQMSFKKCSLSNVLKTTIHYIQNKYIEKEIDFNLGACDEEMYVWANQLLEDVIENLIINAIRHNDHEVPKIEIHMFKEKSGAKNFIRLEFRDNGVGVKDGMKKKIFQRGVGKNESVQGLGLGLSLVKHVLESYRGEIWVEDRVKGDHTKGSKFIILLPEAKNGKYST